MSDSHETLGDVIAYQQHHPRFPARLWARSLCRLSFLIQSRRRRRSRITSQRRIAEQPQCVWRTEGTKSFLKYPLWHIGVDTSRLFNDALLVERFEPSVWVFIPLKSFLNEMKLNIFYIIIFLKLAVLYYLCSTTYISCCWRAAASQPESKQRFSCPLWPKGPSLLASQLLGYRSGAFIDRPTRFWLVKVWPALATPWIWTQVTRVKDHRWCDVCDAWLTLLLSSLSSHPAL